MNLQWKGLLYIFVISIITLFCHLTVANCQRSINEKHINEWVVHISGGVSTAKAVARKLGFIYQHQIVGLGDYYVLSRPEKIDTAHHVHTHRLRRHVEVNWAEQQVARTRRRRSESTYAPTFNDPLYANMWYLNRGAAGQGYDMNVREAWSLGYTGKGAVTTILDDGIDYNHPDLQANYDKMASTDINDKDDDPMPNYKSMENKHGTRCAGEVAASANNNVCGIGVAFNSKVGGVRMLDGDITDRVEAESLSLRQQHIQIFSGSWGPEDNGQQVDGPGTLAKQAFKNGITTGRGGLGNIFVWASGNGGLHADSCACDGYANSVYTLSVSSVSELNRKPWYLEECASTVATTYSSGAVNEKQIVTTDLNNGCTMQHTGTSASAPLAAGIVALMLDANPKLTWRDVQYITLLTANPKPFLDGEFITNGVGRQVSLRYGFGLMDAGKMTRLADLWRTLPTQHTCSMPETRIDRSLHGRFTHVITIDSNGCKQSTNEKVVFLEHVQLFVDAKYDRRGDLRIMLKSPSGTMSVMLPPRRQDAYGKKTNLEKWPLMSVQFWGEPAEGKWSVQVDNSAGQFSYYEGQLASVRLVLYGSDRQPINLRPPNPSRLPPEEWFKTFEHYVLTDADYEKKVGPLFSEKPVVNQAIKCHEECANDNCKGEGPYQCYTCKNFKNVAGMCVPSCPYGTFGSDYRDKTGSRMCSACHDKCATCKGNTQNDCLTCHFEWLYNPAKYTCLQADKCPSGYYRLGSRCLECSRHCSRCSSDAVCHECAPSRVLTLRYTCAKNCDPHSYPGLDRRCRLCNSTCKTCLNAGSHGCLTCPNGWALLPLNRSSNSGSCVLQCPAGFFKNSTSEVCQECSPECDTCTGPNPSSCLVCRSPLVLHNNSCIDPVSIRCKENEYLDAQYSCKVCDSSCAVCAAEEGKSRCLKCADGSSYLHKGACLATCPPGFYGSLSPGRPKSSSLPSTAPSSQRVCLPCQPTCAVCSGPAQRDCTQCVQGLTRIQEHCDRNCSLGSSTCSPCDKNCHVCLGPGPSDCFLCVSGRWLLDGQCLTTCPNGMYPSEGRCMPCHSSCRTCIDGNICSSCSAGLTKTAEGTCKRQLMMCRYTQFLDFHTQSCKNCSNLCRTCRGESRVDCLSCRSHHCRSNVTSCLPCCTSVESSAKCGLCIAGKDDCIPPSLYLSIVSPPDPNLPDDNMSTGEPDRWDLVWPVALLITCLVTIAFFLLVFTVLQARAYSTFCWCSRGLGYGPLPTDDMGEDWSDLKTTSKEIYSATSSPTIAKASDTSSDQSSGLGSASPVDMSPDRVYFVKTDV